MNMPGSTFSLFPGKPDFHQITPQDIVVMQRCYSLPQYKFMQVLVECGVKLIYDLDDNVFDVPDYNPCADMLHQYREGFLGCIQMVDVVTVSTRELAKVVREKMRAYPSTRTGKQIPVVVVENRIDPKLFAKPTPPNHVIVGWQGSSSHIGDLVLVEDAIKTLVYERPDVTYQFRGHTPPPSLTKFSNVQHKLWMPVAEYAARMPTWGWSIALAPVVDHPFNASKSCIKMIEAGYCGVPCLASWVAPYESFCSKDKELMWLLCAGKSSWEKKLRELINDPARRKELGERCQKVVDLHYSWDKPHLGWEEALNTVRSI
jgi:O-antigen biosynthesis protein